MKGFDPEFTDLDHYIRVITERIWEGRRIDDIHRYYSADCAVETPAAVTMGVAPVIQSTRDTLVTFPDRELLAEDVLWSGDEEGGFLSSHRILSPMTHLGDGAFGAPTGRRIHVRTIADCVCLDNRVIHEWLVRDQAAIARQIGLHERELAQRWLAQRGPIAKPPMPAPPRGYRSDVQDGPLARAYRTLYEQLWAGHVNQAVMLRYDRAASLAAPGGDTAYGDLEIAGFWKALISAFPRAQLSVEHLAEVRRPGRNAAVALRWRVQTWHEGPGRYGEPSGRPLTIMGISHAEFAADRILREWLLMDDVAQWMQILAPHN
jgi:SnoaL-like polyketide cyclase